MDDKKIEEICEKILEGMGPYQRDRDRYSEDSPEIKRSDARAGAASGEPERPQTYQDWLKGQDQSGMPIGIHKRKRQGRRRR